MSSPRVALQVEKNRAHGRALLQGVADYALEHTDWRLELVEPAQLLDVGYVRQFDGLIVRIMDDATANVLTKARRPVVDTYRRKSGGRIPSACLDDRAIAEMAFRCFEEHHYHAFAYCGFAGLRFSDARGAAFEACAVENSHVFFSFVGPSRSRITDKFFRDEKTAAPDADALGKWLAMLPKPVAVFCCNDVRAVQVLNVCADNGIAVPKDVAVMGVDNDVLLCTFASPPLSSIDTDPFSLGRKAAEMLHRQMSAKMKGKVFSIRRFVDSSIDFGIETLNGSNDQIKQPIDESTNRKIFKPLEPLNSDLLHPPRRVVERLSTDAYPFETPWLDEAVRYIRRNLSGGVTSADVVRHVGYSHPTVNKAFEDELGHSVKKEILLQRGKLACALLRDTDNTLAEIADRCGYRSPQYFSHCFAEAFKVTPDVWRRRAAFQKT